MELIFANSTRSNTPVSLEAISSAASSMLGKQADEFVTHFVSSRNELDIARLLGTLELDSVGQSYAGELYIKIKGPSPLRESWARF
jgi:predicted metalloprotease with PDZ domain